MHHSWKQRFIAITACMLFNSVCMAAVDPSVTHSALPFNQDELNSVQEYLFNNITSDTQVVVKKDQGQIIRSIPGAVLASPSNKGMHFSQDYQFHWVRDAAITMNGVTTLYAQASPDRKKQLQPYLFNYVAFATKTQKQISNHNEQTLGQPKFNIDGSVWEGKWGRPQNDGPALRVITMTHIAKLFLQENKTAYVHDQLLPIIQTDLAYIATEWRHPTFDLWEEIKDKDHFFTKMVQRKALLEGADLLKQLGDATSAVHYTNEAKHITASLQKHWNQKLGYFSETIHQQYVKGGGLDSSILLGVLYGNLNDANDPFALNNDRVMSSVYFIRNAFAKLYKINLSQHQQIILIGRYPNDIYDGDQFVYGNPWILITNALAEYYYALANIYLTQKQINITQNNILFFQQIAPHLIQKTQLITVKNNPEQFNAIVDRLINEGDKILQGVKQYSTCYADKTCGHFAEQVDRATGEAMSAKDLTWGYTTLLEAMQTRSQLTNAKQ